MITTDCTCDEPSTLLSVDMGPEDGGVVEMCPGCYDELREN